MDDPNINPLWDAFLGQNTNSGVVRLVGAVVVFILVAGTLFWLAA